MWCNPLVTEASILDVANDNASTAFALSFASTAKITFLIAVFKADFFEAEANLFLLFVITRFFCDLIFGIANLLIIASLLYQILKTIANIINFTIKNEKFKSLCYNITKCLEEKSMQNKRIVFMGTPQFAATILEALIQEKYNIVAVVTQQDKKVGRKQEIQFSSVKQVALKYNVPVLQPYKIKEEYEQVLQFQPDCIITCAYGQFVPEAVLNYPKYKCINIHASLLPKYRGGAPIHYAILNGEKQTGISIMQMSKTMDAGDICYQKTHPISDTITTTKLFEELAETGKIAILESLPKILNHDIVFQKQDESQVSFAYTIKKEQEQLDFTQNTKQVYNHIRALSDIPGAFVIIQNKKIKLFDANYEIVAHNEYGKIEYKHKQFYFYLKDGILKVNQLQLEGKVKMMADAFYNGFGKNLTSFIG